MEHTSGLLVHYYLNNDEHLIDANLRNRCEAELLALYLEAAKVFDLKFTIVAMPPHEGGFKEYWQWLRDNNTPITSLAAIIASVSIFMSALPSENDRLNKQLATVNIQKSELEVEKNQLEIQKLKIDIAQMNEETKPELIEAMVKVLKTNNQVVTRRSNFYKNLSITTDVRKVGVGVTGSDGELIGDESTVQRKEFPRFVLRTSKLPSITDETALIEIIAPVIDEGPYRWKGLYQGSPITFQMQDMDFKGAVMAETISFKHGSKIQCVLEIFRRLDEAGEETITGYAVQVVIGMGDNTTIQETPQGGEYKRTSKEKKAQTDMFDNYHNAGDFS